MQGLRDPSFLPTRKNPAPAGEYQGQFKVAFSEVSMYSFMASLSGPETEYRQPLGMVEPGIRSIAQSYGRCEGRDHCRGLAKKLLGDDGIRGRTEVRSGYSESVAELAENRLISAKFSPWVDLLKQSSKQSFPHPLISPVLQLTWGS